MMLDDTIAAISTPLGEGGIGIVRISGPIAFKIANQIFMPRNRERWARKINYTLHLGNIQDPSNGEVIDEVLVSIMANPRSFTKEDVIEINCHGGLIPLQKTLSLILQAGGRLAEPGEFSRRAFLNGRLDLVQAEAIIDLIRAKTETGLKLAMRQLEGKLSTELTFARDELVKVLAFIEAGIDFPEDDIDEMTMDEIRRRIEKTREKIQELVDRAQVGKIFREGLRTVILGKPNVGKSSLLNALLREKRAIVTEIPGTTRDVIEEALNIRGIPLLLMDTAGIRETEDVVEKLGVEKTRDLIMEADLVLVVLDNTTGITDEDRDVLRLIQGKNAVVLLNKIDCSDQEIEDPVFLQLAEVHPMLKISATEEIGLGNLEDEIYNRVIQGQIITGESAVITRTRHQEALRKAANYLGEVIKSLDEGMPPDIISIDVRNAWEAIGEVTGETIKEDILDKIFAEFCIGK
ncbi:MAG: tRNA uridine-5-carboxymethylaminomethyl(34) synthesis GTPase MnmE [Bacillota bacterium]